MTYETIPGILAHASDAYGDLVAVRSAERGGFETVTFAELDQRSAELRDRIAAQVQPGDFVVLSGRNSIAWIVALFAISRSGAVPVPLDSEMSEEPLALILDELAPVAIVADGEFLERTEGVGRVRIALDAPADDAPTATSDAPTPVVEPEPDSLAVVIYTAGTTGRPKGVMLSHRNLSSNVRAVIDAAALTTDDAVFVVLPLYHAFPLTAGCLSAIAAGVTIELESQPARVSSRLRQARPTVILGVPALYETMLRQIRHQARGGWRGRMMDAALATNHLLIRTLGVNAGRLLFRPVHQALGGRVRYAVSGGAPLSPEVARDAFLFGIPLLQGYGISEASPAVSIQRFHHRRFWWTKYYWKRAGSVGPPLQGVTVTAAPVSEAEAGSGELVISGPTVMLGYFGRDEETADTLVDGRLRTGDIGRIDPDGTIWITGRRKLAVSTPGGETVHFERVEAVLQSAPEIAQVCVIEEREPSWRLVAIVFPSATAGGETEPAEVQRSVRAGVTRESERLRPYERVREIRLTDEPLPTTQLGKIQRGSLPSAFQFDLERWRAAAG